MNNTWILLIGYFIGFFVYGMWLVGDKEVMTEFRHDLEEDRDLSIFPESVLRIICFGSVIVVSIFWPWHIISAPFKAFYRVLIKGERSDDK